MLGVDQEKCLRNIWMAQKSGMLAAESIFDAIADEENQITEGLMLHNYEQKIKDSSIHKELHAVRNVKPAFAQYGLFGGMAYTGLFYVLGRGKQIILPIAEILSAKNACA